MREGKKTLVYRNEDREKIKRCVTLNIARLCLLFTWVFLKIQVDCWTKSSAEGSPSLEFGCRYWLMDCYLLHLVRIGHAVSIT